MADSVKRVVTGVDVYAWMTPVEGVPGRYHHNTAVRGDEIEVSADEAKRGEGLGFLSDPDAAAAAEEEAAAAEEDEASAPPKAANKGTWVEFALAQEVEDRGIDVDDEDAVDAVRAELDAMTKDDLVAKYSA